MLPTCHINCQFAFPTTSFNVRNVRKTIAILMLQYCEDFAKCSIDLEYSFNWELKRDDSDKVVHKGEKYISDSASFSLA